MNARTFLEQVKVADAQIESTMAEIETLRAIAEKTTQSLGGERVQTSGSQDRIADCVVRIIELQSRLNDEVDQLVDYRTQVREVVNRACSADCHKLLHKRYIGTYDDDAEKIVFKTWEQIAVEMGFTFQWVSDGLHKKALAQVQKELDRREQE